jgi:hypothetical protein
MTSAETAFRFAFALMEAPKDTDANLISAFSSFASTRVVVAAGFEELFSPITGRIHERSAAWPIAARAAKVPIHEDLGRVITGPLPGISILQRNEFATPGLDSQRFATLRTIIGRQGFFISNGKVMASAGSDFQLVQHRRIMDKACAVARNALLNFLNDSVNVDAATGFILEKDAQNIEAFVEGQLDAALLAPGSASAIQVTVKRDENILSSQTLRVTIRIVPLGYAKTIVQDIGFTNPALQIKAA